MTVGQSSKPAQSHIRSDVAIVPTAVPGDSRGIPHHVVPATLQGNRAQGLRLLRDKLEIRALAIAAEMGRWVTCYVPPTFASLLAFHIDGVVFYPMDVQRQRL